MRKKILMAEMLEFESEYRVGSHHYAKLFSDNGYEVLWLGPIFNQLYSIKDKDMYKKRYENSGNLIHKKQANIFSYSPYSYYLYGNYIGFRSIIANELSIRVTKPNIAKVLERNNFLEVDILWITNVKYKPLIDIVKYKKLVYRCSDDIAGFDNCCNSMLELEKDIILKSDVTFVTAYDLLEKKAKLGGNIKYLPNGVELGNFIRASYNMPNEFINDDKKKCIYIGAIEKWFDVDLIYECCNSLKDINFYLIGPIKTDLQKISNLKNAFILGPKDYNNIPNYIYYSDVALIPFKINDLTNSITPIKLFEYMSLGKEVVSTAFKEMNNIDSPALIAENSSEFIENIKFALNNKNKEKKIIYSKNNTWESRFKKVINMVDGYESI